jgi:hypothetical protein
MINQRIEVIWKENSGTFRGKKEQENQIIVSKVPTTEKNEKKRHYLTS